MCAGTAVGGWRIIKTLGHKMVRLHPVHGFAAETTSATMLVTAAHFGMPVSTTHAVTTSIMGVGCAKGFNHLKLEVVERIIWAWIMTLPASGGVAYLLVKLAQDRRLDSVTPKSSRWSTAFSRCAVMYTFIRFRRDQLIQPRVSLQSVLRA